MNNIAIPEKDYELLRHMMRRIMAQDNRLTAHPLYCVYQKQIVFKAEGCGDKWGWLDKEGHILSEKEEAEAIAEYREENPEDAKDLTDVDIIEHKLENRKVEYSIEDVPVSGQTYLTEKAAQDHIDRNHYHYKEPFVYVESAWRNFEMQNLRRIICAMFGSALMIIAVIAGPAEASALGMSRGVPAQHRAKKPPANLWKGIIAEAVGEGFEGQYAAACVCRNRLKKGMNTGLAGLKRNDLDAFVAKEGPEAEKTAKEIVADVFEHNSEDTTGGALYFESTDFERPWWAKDRVKTVQIGKHIFYK
jgi:hypothetical protein